MLYKNAQFTMLMQYVIAITQKKIVDEYILTIKTKLNSYGVVWNFLTNNIRKDINIRKMDYFKYY